MFVKRYFTGVDISPSKNLLDIAEKMLYYFQSEFFVHVSLILHSTVLRRICNVNIADIVIIIRCSFFCFYQLCWSIWSQDPSVYQLKKCEVRLWVIVKAFKLFTCFWWNLFRWSSNGHRRVLWLAMNGGSSMLLIWQTVSQFSSSMGTQACERSRSSKTMTRHQHRHYNP